MADHRRLLCCEEQAGGEDAVEDRYSGQVEGSLLTSFDGEEGP